MSPPVSWKPRRGELTDLAAIAALYRRTASREWDFLYPHTPEEDVSHFGRSFRRGVVWVVEVEGAPAGFCAVRRGWIDHLYVDHAFHGRGIGQALVARALRGRRRVRLWTFQKNTRSRRFYRLQGFSEILQTDGADNEEKEPDVLLEWRRHAPVD
jgi:putative acetyltransferase